AQARRCTPASHPRPRISTLPNERLRHRPAKNSSSGGLTWWAHFEFTRINIERIILRKKIEDLRFVRAFHVVRGEVFTFDRVRRDLVGRHVRRLYEQLLEHVPTSLTECRPKDSSIWTRLSIMATVEPCPGPRSSIAMS